MNTIISVGDIVGYVYSNNKLKPESPRYTVLELNGQKALCKPIDAKKSTLFWIPLTSLKHPEKNIK